MVLTLLIPLTGAGQKLRLANHWMPQSQFAGMYVAKEMGFYDEVGLDVDITHATASRSALGMLKDGEVDVITQFLSNVVKLTGDEDPNLVNILQLSHKGSLLLVMRDPIEDIKDLNDKKIGTWSAGFDEPAIIFQKQHSLNLNWIPYLFDVVLFVVGAIDGTVCMEYNEYYGLLSCGYDLTEEHYIRFSDIGLDIPEDGLYVTKEFYEENRDALKKFVEQTKRGWEWARENREKTVDIVMDYANRFKDVNNRKLQTHMLNVVLQKQLDQTTGKPSFYITKERYDYSCKLLKEFGFVKDPKRYEDIIINF